MKLRITTFAKEKNAYDTARVENDSFNSAPIATQEVFFDLDAETGYYTVFTKNESYYSKVIPEEGIEAGTSQFGIAITREEYLVNRKSHVVFMQCKDAEMFGLTQINYP